MDVEARIPADHPLRTIKAVADQALAKLSKVISNSYQLWVLEWIMPTMRAGAKPSTVEGWSCQFFARKIAQLDSLGNSFKPFLCYFLCACSIRMNSVIGVLSDIKSQILVYYDNWRFYS